MKTREGWGPLGLIFGLLGVMFVLAALFGSGRGAEAYQTLANTVPIDPPAHPLSIPEQSYDNMLTAQEWSAWAAIIGAGVGLCTLATLIWTLHTTRSLLEQARRTTKAAEDTVLATLEIGRKQVRCYPHIIRLTANFDWDRGAPAIILDWGNTGNSPALQPELILRLSYGRFPTDDHPDTDVTNNFRVVSLGDLGGQSRKENEETYDLISLFWEPGPLLAARAVVDVTACIITSDVFGEINITHAHSLLVFENGSTAPGALTSGPNSSNFSLTDQTESASLQLSYVRPLLAHSVRYKNALKNYLKE